MFDPRSSRDQTIDGIRYIQAPLSYPEERRGRLGSVATGETFPHGQPPTALLIYDSGLRAFPPRYDAGWSNWYTQYPRRADLNHIVAPYVAAQGAYLQVSGVGEVGWFGKARDPFGVLLPEPLPAWRLGPKSAIAFEEAQRAADAEHYAAGGGESSPGSSRRKMPGVCAAGRASSPLASSSPPLLSTGLHHGVPKQASPLSATLNCRGTSPLVAPDSKLPPVFAGSNAQHAPSPLRPLPLHETMMRRSTARPANAPAAELPDTP